MKIIQIILCSLFSTFICATTSESLSTPTLPWNIVIFMEASAGGLYQAAFKNIDELLRNAPQNAHIFVFLHTQGTTGWLYRVTKNNLHKIATITCDFSVAQSIIDVMTIATLEGPALRHGLVLWNHGYGILNPLYDEEQNDWKILYDGPYDTECALKRSRRNAHHLHRGTCITNNHTFLSNEDMAYAFDVICNSLLSGTKLAFCGMDLCKGAMIEHAYQLRNYVDYLIGSQECELLDGWPYDTVFQMIHNSPHASTEKIIMQTVDAYNNYYEQHTEENRYTLSALDLKYAKKIKENVDMVSDILTTMLARTDHVKPVVKQLRTQCKAFCDAPMYCDLQQWYTVLLTTLNECDATQEKYAANTALVQLLIDGLELLSHMTVARCNGSAAAHAHGCSIYFPQFAINESYFTAPFAQESSWIQFLEKFLA